MTMAKRFFGFHRGGVVRLTTPLTSPPTPGSGVGCSPPSLRRGLPLPPGREVERACDIGHTFPFERLAINKKRPRAGGPGAKLN